MNIDLYQLAIEAGMTEEEFEREISRIFIVRAAQVLIENQSDAILLKNYCDAGEILVVAKLLRDECNPLSALLN